MFPFSDHPLANLSASSLPPFLSCSVYISTPPVPGLSIAIATTEIASRHYFSGLIRFMGVTKNPFFPCPAFLSFHACGISTISSCSSLSLSLCVCVRACPAAFMTLMEIAVGILVAQEVVLFKLTVQRVAPLPQVTMDDHTVMYIILTMVATAILAVTFAIYMRVSFPSAPPPFRQW